MAASLSVGSFRPVEGSLLNEVVHSLMRTKLCLLDEMTNDQISQLIQTNGAEDAQQILHACERQLESTIFSLQNMSEWYGERVNMSKEDMKKELLAAEYTKRPRLNKFEQLVNIQMNALVEETLDNTWRDHQNRLVQTWDEMLSQDINIQRWGEKIAFLRTVVKPDVTRVDSDQAVTRAEDRLNPDTISATDHRLESTRNDLSPVSRDEEAQTTSVLSLSTTSSNPDKIPIVRFPPPSSSTNAFAGLDRYALELFAKTPTGK